MVIDGERNLTLDKIGASIVRRMSNSERAFFPLDILIFVNKDGKKIPLRSKRNATLEDVLWRFFELTNTYKSVFSKSRNTQCVRGSFRSAWDIWRHVVDVLPSTPLSNVMGSLYLMRGELRIQYCSVVRRRVFYPTNWVHGLDAIILNKKQIDEFGLTWNEWETLV